MSRTVFPIESSAVVAYPVQNHPQDSRVTIEEDANTVQTLNAKMGTGGGNTPMILIELDASRTQGADGGTKGILRNV